MSKLKLTHKLLDRLAYEKPDANGQPLDMADLIDADNGRWLVYDPKDPKEPWSLNDGSGGMIRVPVVPHLSKDCDPTNALGYAWQLGFNAAHELITSGVRFTALHLALATPMEQLFQEGSGYPAHFRFWLGFAVKLES